MAKIVAVGFGEAVATCDGELVADGEKPFIVRNGKKVARKGYIRFADIEKLAVAKPRSDWRIKLFSPLHGEVYQRQGKAKWVLVEKNQGFA
jgi:hypothetical protein